MESNALMQFVPSIVISLIMFGLPSYFFAKRKGENPWKFLILCSVPFLGYFLLLTLMGMHDKAVMDRLEEHQRIIESLTQRIERE